MRIFYMLDNHTFLSLPKNPDEALPLILKEASSGYSHGTLCVGGGAAYGHVRMHGMADWSRFEKDARKWFEQFSPPPQENDL